MGIFRPVVGMISAGIICAGLISSPVLAWHPKGVITKYVQNQTTDGAISDANDAAHAVAAKPGDILKYTITVSNIGTPDNEGLNDMAQAVMTDNLPYGIQLVADPSMRTITADLDTIKPGQKVVKEYIVKVTATNEGTIENKACFTGDSTVNDNPQAGCDAAIVTVTVPVVPPEPPQPPTPAPTPTSSATPQPPAVMPATGSVEIMGGLAGMGTVGYATVAYMRSKRNLRGSHTRT